MHLGNDKRENYLESESMQKQDLSILEKRLEYQFQNRKYLITALTHSSYANEVKGAGKAMSGWNSWEILC